MVKPFVPVLSAHETPTALAIKEALRKYVSPVSDEATESYVSEDCDDAMQASTKALESMRQKMIA